MLEGIRLASAYVSLQPKVDTKALTAETSRISQQFQKQMQSKLNQTHLGGVSASQFQGLRAGIRGVAKDYEFAQQSQGRFSKATASLGKTLRPVVQGANNISRSISGLGRQVGLTAFQFGVAGTTITAAVTGPIALATGMLTKLGLQTAMAIEDAQVRLKGLLPVGTNIEALIDRLTKKAQKSPVFGPEDVLKFVQDLVGAGTDLKTSERTFGAIDKIFTAYGVHGDAARMAILGVTQVIRKGRAYGEELTQQIGEQIPIWHLLAKAAGVSDAEMQKQVKDGKITAKVFEGLLVKISNMPEVMRSATEGTKTLSGQWEMLKEQIKVTLAQGFLKHFPEIKKQLNELKPVLMEVINWFISHIGDMLAKTKDFIDHLKAIKKAWDSWTPEKKQNVLQTIGVLAAAGPILTILGGIGSSLNAIVSSAALLFSPGGWFVLGIAAAAAGMFLLYQNSEQVRQSVKAFVDSFAAGWQKYVQPAAKKLADSVNKDLTPALEDLAHSLGFKDLKSFGAWLGTTFAQAIAAWILSLADVVRAIAAWIRWLAAVVRSIKGVIAWLGHASEAFQAWRARTIVQILTVVGSWVSGLRRMANSFSEWRARTIVQILTFFTFWIQTWGRMKNYVVSKFAEMIVGIKSKWDKLTSIVGKPIQFIVNTVYNKGIVPVWNAVASVFSGKKLDTVSFGLPKHADGGMAGYTGHGGKYLPAGIVHAGEYVMPAHKTRKYRPLLEQMHHGELPGFANGGIPGKILRGIGKFAGGLVPGTIIQTIKPVTDLVKKLINAPELHGKTPWMQAVRNIPKTMLEQMISWVKSRDIAPAGDVSWMGSLGGNAIALMVQYMRKSGLRFGIGSAFRATAIDPNAPNGDYHMTGNAVDFTGPLDAIAKYWYKVSSGLLEEIYSGGGGFFVKKGRRVGKSFYGPSVVKDHFDHVHIAATSSAMEAILSGRSNMLGALGGGSGARGVLARWGGVIRQALRLTHNPQTWADAVATLIARESGGNPRAINLSDINAQRGDPSRGLMQTIGSTFRGNHQRGTSFDIYNPLANIAAGLNYIRRRYGSIYNVQQANPNLPARGYDNGGPIPPGDTLIRNQTGGLEMALNQAQGKALEDRIRGDGTTTIVQIGDQVICEIIDGRIQKMADGMVTVLNSGKKV